jgi:hypothetical protein
MVIERYYEFHLRALYQSFSLPSGGSCQDSARWQRLYHPYNIIIPKNHLSTLNGPEGHSPGSAGRSQNLKLLFTQL